MYNLLKLIFKAGNVSEALNAVPMYPHSQGQLHSGSGANCASCSACVQACPVGALQCVDGRLSIDYKKCIFCAACLDACPEQLILRTNMNTPVILPNDECLDISQYFKQKLGRSLHVRHLDAGSCNACDFEMSATLNPYYDVQRFGVDFVASPRHADMVMVTGMVTRNLLQAVQETYMSMPKPSLVMAVGTCACSGSLFGESNYAQMGAVDEVLPVDIYLSGCPPTPKMMAYALIYAGELLAEKLAKKANGGSIS